MPLLESLNKLSVGIAFSAVCVAALIHQSLKASARLKAVQALNATSAPTYVPVAIFVGGTAGIGRGMAEALARHTKGNAHIILVGRNEAAAREIIAGLPKPTSPRAKHEFVQCDATLMKNIQKTTQELRARLPRINYLVLSQLQVKNLKREETEEGIDSKLALMYYGRFKFTAELLPELERTREAGEDAQVYVVASPGAGKYIDWTDLGMKRDYSFLHIRAQVPLYLDIILQEFAVQSPSLTFVHAYPGTVRTGLGDNVESLFFWLFVKLHMTLGYPWTLTYAASGEYMLHAMLKTATDAGAWSIGQDGRVLPEGKVRAASEEERKKLWAHSVTETSVPR